MSRLTPYREIAAVLVRSLGIGRAPWLYVALISIFGITVLGDLTLSSKSETILSLRTAICAFLAVALQVAWSFSASALIRLNTQNATRMVPSYVAYLRRMALFIWVAICVLVGLLGGRSFSEFVFLGFGAGLFMLLISTPFRWPFQWLFAMVALLWVGKHLDEVVNHPVAKTLIASPWAAVTVVYLVMAWLVTRLISPKGNRQAAFFSAMAGREIRNPEAPSRLAVDSFGPVMTRMWDFGYRLLFPWRVYLGHESRKPLQRRDVLARSLLGLGASVHWFMQVFVVAVFGVAALMAVSIFMLVSGCEIKPISSGTAVILALCGLMVAVTPVLSLTEVLRVTQTEQKLMLLLPGMPRGSELNRQLAMRNLRHAVIPYCLAVAAALLLPYSEKDMLFVGSFYLGALLLVPRVLADWSRIQLPTPRQAIFLLSIAVVPVAVGYWFVHQQYISSGFVLAVVLAFVAIDLAIRWRRIAGFAQAFPAGRASRLANPG